jgi:hypothetical protein
MGNYDLYGRAYRTRVEAENAEMAQCAAIDADLAYRKMDELQERQQSEENNIWQYIHMLEQRIGLLEDRLSQTNQTQQP